MKKGSSWRERLLTNDVRQKERDDGASVSEMKLKQRLLMIAIGRDNRESTPWDVLPDVHSLASVMTHVLSIFLCSRSLHELDRYTIRHIRIGYQHRCFEGKTMPARSRSWYASICLSRCISALTVTQYIDSTALACSASFGLCALDQLFRNDVSKATMFARVAMIA